MRSKLLNIHTQNVQLYANGIIVHRDPVFDERELAAFEALEYAFRIREDYLRQRQQATDFKPKSRWHKEDRKQKTEGPSLGERVQKK